MDIRIREYINADKELMRKTWNDFYQCIENKKIIVFGASSGAVHLMKEKTLDIAYFVDNAQAKWAKKGYEKIVIYEPMKENIVNVEHTVRNLKNVEIHNKALWNKKELLQFSFDGAGSSIDKNGITVEAEPLDPDSKVTFVKMDIEGAEMNALEGMKSIIMEQKPKLAICIYHLYDDLWNIPKYIHELVPEYKLYMRHYSKINEETVIYAIL